MRFDDGYNCYSSPIVFLDKWHVILFFLPCVCGITNYTITNNMFGTCVQETEMVSN